MPNRPPVHKPARATVSKVDSRASAHRRGYSRTWRRARAVYLAEHPLCVQCQVRGRVVAAQVVDHIIPHQGDSSLFWDHENNWQSLCFACHNTKTATLDGAFGRQVVVDRDQRQQGGSLDD